MKQLPEFPEQQLFTGAAKSQGFSPQQAPDLTAGLRAQGEQQDRNYKALADNRRKEQQIEIDKKVGFYDMIGSLGVPSAKRAAEFLATSYLDHQAILGHEAAVKAGQLDKYGITDEDRDELNKARAAAAEEGVAFDEVAYKAMLQGENTTAVNLIKGLPKYQRLFAETERSLALQKMYPDYHRRFVSGPTLHRDYRTGEQFTGQQVGTDPVRAGIVNANSRKSFFAEVVGISQTYNPSKAILEPVYQSIEQTSELYRKNIEAEKDLADANILRANALTQFRATGQMQSLIARYSGLLVQDERSGKMRVLSRTEAIRKAFEDAADQYANGRMKNRQQADAVLTQKAAHVDKTYADLYPEVAEEYTAKLDAVDSKVRTLRNVQKAEFTERLDAQLINYALNEWDGSSASLQEVQEQTVRIAHQNGLLQYNGNIVASYLVTARERENKTFWQSTLNEKLKNKTLSVKDLANSAVPTEMRQALMPEAQRLDTIRAQIPPETEIEGDIKIALKQSLGDTSLEKNYVGLNAATFAGMRLYRAKLDQFEKEYGPVEGHEKAIEFVTAQILQQKGDFTVSKWEDREAGSAAFNYLTKFTPPSTFKIGPEYEPEKLKQAVQLDNTVIDKTPLVRKSVLENIVAQAKTGGFVDIPGIYSEIGGNSVDNLNRNLKAAGYEIQIPQRPSSVIGQSTSNPALRRLAQKAQGVFGEQRVHAVANGAAADSKFLSPAAFAHLTGTQGLQRSGTGALTFKSNETLYEQAGKLFQIKGLGFTASEHPLFGGTDYEVHKGTGYHAFDEGFDIGDKNFDTVTDEQAIRKAKLLQRTLNSMNPPLFAEVIGPDTPGKLGKQHNNYVHAGGLMRPVTPEDRELLINAFRNFK